MKGILKSMMFLFFVAVSFACTENEPKLSSEKEILSFQINGIYGEIQKVGIHVPIGKRPGIYINLPVETDVSTLSTLAPIITVSDKATVSPASGAAQDFSDFAHVVPYLVMAEDGSLQEYYVHLALYSPPNAPETRGTKGIVTIVVDTGVGGYAHPSGTLLVYDNDSSKVTAYPNEGYAFEDWNVKKPSDLVPIFPMSNPYSFIPVDGMTLTAEFYPIPNGLTVTVQSENTNRGTVSGGGAVTAGQSIGIYATPAKGYQFEGWYLNGLNGQKISGSANDSYSPSGSCTLYAKFTLIPISMSGPATLCIGSSSTVFISNTTGATYQWDCSLNLSISGSGNSVLVTANSNGAGWVRIKLNGEEVSKHNVWVGAPSDLSILGSGMALAGGTVSFIAATGSPTSSTSFSWSISPTTGVTMYNPYNYSNNIYFSAAAANTTFTIQVTATGPCGGPITATYYIDIGKYSGEWK